jgi:hypothetical protein
VHEIGEEQFRHREALRSLAFGVLWIKQNVYSIRVELKVSADCESDDAAAPDRPEAE